MYSQALNTKEVKDLKDSVNQKENKKELKEEAPVKNINTADIRQLLACYDAEKSFLTKLGGDHKSIKSLRSAFEGLLNNLINVDLTPKEVFNFHTHLQALASCNNLGKKTKLLIKELNEKCEYCLQVMNIVQLEMTYGTYIKTDEALEIILKRSRLCLKSLNKNIVLLKQYKILGRKTLSMICDLDTKVRPESLAKLFVSIETVESTNESVITENIMTRLAIFCKSSRNAEVLCSLFMKVDKVINERQYDTLPWQKEHSLRCINDSIFENADAANEIMAEVNELERIHMLDFANLNGLLCRNDVKTTCEKVSPILAYLPELKTYDDYDRNNEEKNKYKLLYDCVIDTFNFVRDDFDTIEKELKRLQASKINITAEIMQKVFNNAEQLNFKHTFLMGKHPKCNKSVVFNFFGKNDSGGRKNVLGSDKPLSIIQSFLKNESATPKKLY